MTTRIYPLRRYKNCICIKHCTYGNVHIAYDIITRAHVIIKYIQNRSTSKEIETLQLLKTHPNIVSIHDVVRTNKSVYIIYKYAGMPLRRYLKHVYTTKFTMKRVRHIMYQVFRALEHCHRHNIAHSDLTLSNIVIHPRTYALTLIDFGSAQKIVDKKELVYETTTIYYRAPELLLCSDMYTKKIDVWSAGCIFYALLHLKHLFPKDTAHEQLIDMMQVYGHYKCWNIATSIRCAWKFPIVSCGLRARVSCRYHTTQAYNLLLKMLCCDPRKRISVKDALQHPFFTEYTMHQKDIDTYS